VARRSKIPQIGRIHGPEIHLRNSLIGCFPNSHVVNSRMSGRSDLAPLLSPVQSIIPRCCPGLRSEIEIADFKLAMRLKLAVLSADALCRGPILLQHESVGT
jgi:hypothetical protein